MFTKIKDLMLWQLIISFILFVIVIFQEDAAGYLFNIPSWLKFFPIILYILTIFALACEYRYKIVRIPFFRTVYLLYGLLNALVFQGRNFEDFNMGLQSHIFDYFFLTSVTIIAVHIRSKMKNQKQIPMLYIFYNESYYYMFMFSLLAYIYLRIILPDSVQIDTNTINILLLLLVFFIGLADGTYPYRLLLKYSKTLDYEAFNQKINKVSKTRLSSNQEIFIACIKADLELNYDLENAIKMINQISKPTGKRALLMYHGMMLDKFIAETDSEGFDNQYEQAQKDLQALLKTKSIQKGLLKLKYIKDLIVNGNTSQEIFDAINSASKNMGIFGEVEKAYLLYHYYKAVNDYAKQDEQKAIVMEKGSSLKQVILELNATVPLD